MKNNQDNEVVAKIKKIFDEEIRPGVAMDGGDIVFEKYEDQKVYVHMRGACCGCPMSTMTLKMGVEARLKKAIPEIKEVIAL
jgi:NFU1 iron-sulfur cluster scaffold homolog, mitochondrial